MKKLNTICIMCPIGCPLEVTEENGQFSVTGNTCKRGESYGISEFKSPVRVVTSLVKCGEDVVSVKTVTPILKSDIFKVLAAISRLEASVDCRCGDILAQNICNTGSDIVITSNK